MSRVILISVLLFVFFVGTAAAQCTDKVVLACPPFMSLGSPFTLPIRVTNCQGTVESFGFDIIIEHIELDYIGLETAGTLVNQWFYVSAEKIEGSPLPPPLSTPDKVHVSCFNSPGFGVVNNSLLLKVILRPRDMGSVYLSLPPSGMTGDLAGFQAGGTCNIIVPVEPSSWGLIKALYRQ